MLDQKKDDQIEYLWPDCVLAWTHWCGVQTQWRTGMGGATGLDYAGVRAYLDEQGVAGDERREVFGCIQAAERTTLEVWASKHQKPAEQPAPGPAMPDRL